MINLMMIYDGQPVTIWTINCTTRSSVHAIVDARTLHILGRDILENERSSTQAKDSSITPMTPPGRKREGREEEEGKEEILLLSSSSFSCCSCSILPPPPCSLHPSSPPPSFVFFILLFLYLPCYPSFSFSPPPPFYSPPYTPRLSLLPPLLLSLIFFLPYVLL